MSDVTWTGKTQDGDLNNAANYLGGVKPIGNDSVFFSEASVHPPFANMGQFSALTFPLVFIGKDCPVPVGTPGNPFEASVFTKFVHQGPQPACIKGAVTRAICNSSFQIRDGSAMCIEGTDTTAALVVVKGKVTVADNVPVTEVFMSYRDGAFSDAALELGSSSTAVTRFVQRGGAATLNRLCTNMAMAGGLTTILSTAPAATVTFIEIGGSARLNYSSANTIARVNVYAGTLDTTAITNNLTITDIAVWPHGTFLRSDDLVTYGGGNTLEDLTGGDF